MTHALLQAVAGTRAAATCSFAASTDSGVWQAKEEEGDWDIARKPEALASGRERGTEREAPAVPE